MSESAFVSSVAAYFCRRALGLSPVLLAAAAAGFSPALAIAPWGPPAQVQAVSSDVEARVDVVEGRAVLITQAERPATLRRGDAERSFGNGQVELGAGSQVRISLDGQMTLDVFGPSSVEWRAGDEGADVVFHKLGWADISVRAGEHGMALPADWVAEFGRSSFHLRALPGGPTELRHNAGAAITLDWRGDKAQVRPPVSVYAGSSVRLDRPRYSRIEGVSIQAQGTSPWGKDKQSDWPWRTRTDSVAQVQEREVLNRETQTLDQIPGAPSGDIARVRVYETDGSSEVRPLRRKWENGQTYAQVPVASGKPPRVEIETRPSLGDLESERVRLPRRPESSPRVAQASRGRAPVTYRRAPARVTKKAPLPTVKPSPVTTVVPKGTDQTVSPAKPTSPAGQPVVEPVVKPSKKAFSSEQWRGLTRGALNGVGEVAAERGSGVEVRLLGGGRMKVFVSASSPASRWCFTPTKDYLMSPGAVAVFEKDGSLRMKFGEVQEKAPAKGRPSFSQLSN